MPTRNVNLTDELEGFIQARVASGKYQNASDVVRSALRSLERDEREYEARLSLLRSAIDAGDASGTFDGDPFESIREAIQLARKPT